MSSWDREGDWVLYRIRREITSLTIRFRSAPPSVMELAAIRKVVPEFRDSPPITIRDRIGCSRELSLGVLPTHEAQRVVEEVQAVGLEVIAESRTVVGYLPFNRTTRCARLVEDYDEAEALVQSMLQSGVPVEDRGSVPSGPR